MSGESSPRVEPLQAHGQLAEGAICGPLLAGRCPPTQGSMDPRGLLGNLPPVSCPLQKCPRKLLVICGVQLDHEGAILQFK